MTALASTHPFGPRALASDHGADPSTVHAAPREDLVASGRTLASSALLQGARSVQIEHNGAVYRLQATRLGKLILTK